MRGAAGVLLAFLTAGCVSLPPSRDVGCRPVPAIRPAPRAAANHTYLDVLTYNVEGLAWPARSGRAPNLRGIGEHLSRLWDKGEAPDVILFQEVFSPSATRMVERLPYPTLVPGPDVRESPQVARGGSRAGRRAWTKGEIGIKFASSGLVIASRYPAVQRHRSAFARKSCAGIDCLSNKGMVLATLAVPGVPAPVELVTAHLNSQNASRVSERRHRSVHAAQVQEIGSFLRATARTSRPLILAGDLNMRRDEARFGEFKRVLPLTLVHRWCLDKPGRCDVDASWDGDAPWLDTQDLHFFSPGQNVSIKPVAVQAWFDGKRGERLSDHDGLWVRYRLSWAPQTPLEQGSHAILCRGG